MYAKYVTSCILKSTFFFFLEVSQYFCPSSVPTQYDVGPTARFNIIQQKKERKKCKSFWGELILICWWTLRTLMSAHLRFYQSHEHFRLIRDAVFFSFFLWSFLPIIVTKQKKKWSWGLSTGNISCREDPSNKSTFLHLPPPFWFCLRATLLPCMSQNDDANIPPKIWTAVTGFSPWLSKSNVIFKFTTWKLYQISKIKSNQIKKFSSACVKMHRHDFTCHESDLNFSPKLILKMISEWSSVPPTWKTCPGCAHTSTSGVLFFSFYVDSGELKKKPKQRNTNQVFPPRFLPPPLRRPKRLLKDCEAKGHNAANGDVMGHLDVTSFFFFFLSVLFL